MKNKFLTDDDVKTFEKEGVILIKGLFSNFIDVISRGIEKNLSCPGPYAAENLSEGEEGRFFDDYCNWKRIEEFKNVAFKSCAGKIASMLMRSKRVQLFHEHVLVKEPGTNKATPWHQDSPYYFVEGSQTVSFWTPLEEVKTSTLRCVAGSHMWNNEIFPTRWKNEGAFYSSQEKFMPVPDPEKENMKIKEWQMNPGDAVAFNFRVLHGARGNETKHRRRAFSLRLLGDDVKYRDRPGPTSPPFPGHGMQNGDALRRDWFPIIFDRSL